LRIQRTYVYYYDNGTSEGDTTSYVDLDGVYTYDNEGRITGIQYPLSGPNLTWTFDSMGRLNGMSDGGGAGDLISGSTYGPSSEMLSLTGKVNESRTYNSMLQLTQLSASAYNNSQSVNISYAYSASQNNGKIISQTDNVSGEQVVYTYDALNRLATAEATSNTWGQSYSYDGFGTLTGQSVIAGSAPTYSATPNPSTNQISTSDANGNPASVNGYAAVYDVQNRYLGMSLFTYGYQQGLYQYS
jgi:YD repeat-containing protein